MKEKYLLLDWMHRNTCTIKLSNLFSLNTLTKFQELEENWSFVPFSGASLT